MIDNKLESFQIDLDSRISGVSGGVFQMFLQCFFIFFTLFLDVLLALLGAFPLFYPEQLSNMKSVGKAAAAKVW